MATWMPPRHCTDQTISYPDYWSDKDPNPNNHHMWAEKSLTNLIRINNLPLNYTREMAVAALGNDPNITRVAVNTTQPLPEGPSGFATVEFTSKLAANQAVSRMNGTSSPYISIGLPPGQDESEIDTAQYFQRYGVVEDVKFHKAISGIHLQPVHGIVVFQDLMMALNARLGERKRLTQKYRVVIGPYTENMAELEALNAQVQGMNI